MSIFKDQENERMVNRIYINKFADRYEKEIEYSFTELNYKI